MFHRPIGMPAYLLVAVLIAADSSVAGSDLSIWETGGMYFCVPYVKGSAEIDLDGWYQNDTSGYSVYGSYVFSDRTTLKLEIPIAFKSAPFIRGMKVTGLFGVQNKQGDLTLSADANVDFNSGEGWRQITPSLGCNGGKRWGVFALLSRVSGGITWYSENRRTSRDGVCEVEVGSFLYTGDIGMVGLPLMFEYGKGEFTVNCALDWEVYLPKGFSLWIVPRYEVYGGSGFSLWTGIAWMRMP